MGLSKHGGLTQLLMAIQMGEMMKIPWDLGRVPMFQTNLMPHWYTLA